MGNDIRFLAKRYHYWLVAILLLSATGTLAQSGATGARARPFCEDGIRISWKAAEGAASYRVLQILENGELRSVCFTTDNDCKLEGLEQDSRYSFYVDAEVDGELILADQSVSATTYGREDCVSRSPRKTPTPKPSVDTCSHLPASIVVRNFDTYTTQCKQVDAAGIGRSDLIAQGVIGAVDIWQDVATDVQVCFRSQGALKFLDASTSPRAVLDLPAQTLDGMTCGTIDRPGTVVLMHSTETSSSTIESPPQAEPEPSSATIEMSAQTEPPSTIETQPELEFPHARALIDCPVSTSDILNFRQGPGLDFGIKREIPYQTLLTATERAGDWFKVEYAGEEGWIYYKLVRRHGICAWA